MPISPIVIIYGSDGKSIPGPIPVTDSDASNLSGCYAEEFQHCVYTILKDYFYSLLYGVDFVRKHTPMIIVKQIDKMSVPLMKYMISGTFFKKVEIRWFQHDKKTGTTEEYFRMTLEHVRLDKIRHLLPDAKNQIYERYNHLEEMQLIFQKITWLFTKGYLTYTDIWNEAFGELDRKDFADKTEPEDIAETPMVEQLKIKFTAGVFEEPKDGFVFDKKATVKFNFTANRKPDNRENKVYVKLYAIYNGKTEDLCLTNEGRLVAADSWCTEFKLKTPESYTKDTAKTADATVEYFAEIENKFAEGNFKSDTCRIGGNDGDGLPDFDPGEKEQDDLDYFDDYPIPAGEGEDENEFELPDFDPGTKEPENSDFYDDYPVPKGEGN